MNDRAFRQIGNWGMAYAFDGRGMHPYIPNIDSETLNHMQLPTVPPTPDELIGVEDIAPDSVTRHTLKMIESNRDQAFTLHTELGGQKLAPIFHKLLRGWHVQSHRLESMDGYYATLDRSTLPVQPVTWGEVIGRNGSLIVQSA